MFIPDPDFIHIPDPTTETKEGEKVFVVTNITKL
jgi:hypothetical protein